jgi:hypothetical protein
MEPQAEHFPARLQHAAHLQNVDFRHILHVVVDLGRELSTATHFDTFIIIFFPPSLAFL